MTPKEKAQELVLKFVRMNGMYTSSINSALLVVDEIIKNSFTIKEMLKRKGELDEQKLWYYIDDSAVSYWQKVKTELENYDG